MSNSSKLSILPAEMRGVMHITGYRGLGKTFLASQADLPENVAFLDFENKGEGVHAQIGFGLYVPVTQLEKSGAGVWRRTIDTVAGLEQDRFTVLVLDNVQVMEQGGLAEVQSKPVEYGNRYGISPKNIASGSYGGGRGCVNYMISELCASAHARGVHLVIAISHVKGKFNVPGRFDIKGADRWSELSILSLVLIPGAYAPVPAALVRKEQLGVITAHTPTEEQVAAVLAGEVDMFEVKRRLPRRIPHCTFQAIRHYLTVPANLGKPGEGEEPTEAEIEPFIERLSAEQLAFVTASLQAEARQAEAEEEVSKLLSEGNPAIEQAKALLSEGKSNAEVRAVTGLAMGEIVKLRNL